MMQRIAKILIIFELIIVMYMTYMITDTYRYSMKDYYKIQDFNYDGIYFSSMKEHKTGSFMKVKDRVEKLDGFLGWSYTIENNSDDKNSILQFDKYSSSLFSIDVLQGKWFGNKKENGLIPCVIVKNSSCDKKVGEKLAIKDKKYIVTGIVSDKKEFFDISDQYSNGSDNTLSELSTRTFTNEKRIILCASDADKKVKYKNHTSVIAYFNKDTSKENINKALNILREQGTTETFGELKKVTYRECYYNMMEYAPFCFMFLFVSLLGLITYTVINSRKTIRRYGIMSLYGCRWSTIVNRYFYGVFGIGIVASVIAGIYAVREHKFLPVVTITDIVISLLYAAISIALLNAIKGRKNPIECIKF